MRSEYFILFVVFLQCTSTFCADESSDELEESIQSVIQAFRNHDHDFVDEMKSVVPKIFKIARAEISVALGSLNVSIKAEEKFVELQEELSNYSELFSKTMKDMDGEYINLRRCVAIVAKVMKKRREFLEAGEEDTSDLAREFENAYEDELVIISDLLFNSLYNEFHPKEGLFERFAVKSHEHPVETAEFIHGCLQIFTQLTILEINHVELTMNTEEAVEGFQNKAEKRWNKVLRLAVDIINRHQSNIASIFPQIAADQIRFHDTWSSVSHCDFAHQAKMYFNGKYPKYKFFVISYSTVSTFDQHIVSKCVPTFTLFRHKNRNSIVSLIPNRYGGVHFFDWARNILDKVPTKIRTKHNRAQSVFQGIVERAGLCQFAMIFVVSMRASVCYSGPRGYSLETMKNAEVCNTRLCWVKNVYPQRVIVAGRVV